MIRVCVCASSLHLAASKKALLIYLGYMPTLALYACPLFLSQNRQETPQGFQMSDRVGVISHHTMMIAGSYRCATAFMTDIRYFVGDKGFH